MFNVRVVYAATPQIHVYKRIWSWTMNFTVKPLEAGLRYSWVVCNICAVVKEISLPVYERYKVVVEFVHTFRSVPSITSNLKQSQFIFLHSQIHNINHNMCRIYTVWFSFIQSLPWMCRSLGHNMYRQTNCSSSQRDRFHSYDTAHITQNHLGIQSASMECHERGNNTKAV